MNCLKVSDVEKSLFNSKPKHKQKKLKSRKFTSNNSDKSFVSMLSTELQK